MSQSKLQTGEKILDKIKVNGLIQEEKKSLHSESCGFVALENLIK